MISKRYLGDGVYAAVENGMVKLTTENGIATTNTIWLEIEVMIQLQKFFEDAMAPHKEKNTNSPGPTCGICGKTMTPENATIHPEFFLCDDCARSEQVKAWEKEVKSSIDSMRVYPPKEIK